MTITIKIKKRRTKKGTSNDRLRQSCMAPEGLKGEERKKKAGKANKSKKKKKWGRRGEKGGGKALPFLS